MSIYQNKLSRHGKPYTPYFYVIGWSALDRWYVGCRYANRKGYCAHPDELMVTYFTSSPNYVHPFIEQHGLPDVKWTFPCKTAEEAIACELRIMNEFHNFLPDERWINHHSKKAFLISDEVREKLSAARKGKPSPNGGKLKGRKLSEETKERMRESAKSSWKSKTRKKRRSISEETRKKISESKKGNRKSKIIINK